MGRRSRRRGARESAPAATTDYRDAEGNVLTLRDELTEVTCAGVSYWTLGEPPEPVPDGVRALAGFDEWVLGYTDRSPVLAPRFFERVVPGMNGVFFPTLVEDGAVVGTWKRVVTRGRAGVTVDPFPGVRARVRYREAAAAVLPFRGEG